MQYSSVPVGCVCLAFVLIAGAPSPLRAEKPVDFSKADTLINEAIARGDCPGAVLVVGRSAGTVYEKAYGSRALEPAKEAMTLDTIFDLASLTKPVATATSILILIDRGRIDPQAAAVKYLPELSPRGKDKITVEQLLLHRAGLVPDNSIKDYADAPEKAWERICDLKLQSEPGKAFAYSDVGFIVLGKLVTAADEKHRPLDQFAAEEIFAPMKMGETRYLPPTEWKARMAPTEKRGGEWMRGQVHDPRAFALGGVAGHAGLFSTGADLGRFCRMMLGKGELDVQVIFGEKTWKLAATGNAMPDGSGNRSYGFDVKTGYSQPLGDRFTPLKSFGHTGFTGTCFWVSPPDDLYFILLTNAVHPVGKGKVLALRRAVSTAIAEAVLGRSDKP